MFYLDGGIGLLNSLLFLDFGSSMLVVDSLEGERERERERNLYI